MFTFEVILNAFSTGFSLYWIGKYSGEYSMDLHGIEGDLKVATILERMNSDNGFDFNYFIATVVGIQFVRILILLKAHRTFGPMIKTIFVMFYDLFVFMIIFLCVFFIFEVTGELLFDETQGSFDTFTNSCITLYSSALGEFNYEIFSGLSKNKKIIGYIYMTVYLAITLIMLLNFLIAIFSDTYVRLTETKRGLYMQEVINLRKIYEFHPLYSSIVYS